MSERESNNVLDSGFHAVDSGFRHWIPIFASETWILGPVVLRPISTKPGLNLNPGLFFFSSKAFSRRIFSSLFRLANHQIVDKKNETEFAFFKAFISEFKFRTILGLS